MSNWAIGKCASCGAEAGRGAEACPTCGARFTVDKPAGVAGALFALSWLIGLGVFFGMRGGETLGAIICVSGVAWLAALRVQAPIKGMIVKGLVLTAALSLSACAGGGVAGDPSGTGGSAGLPACAVPIDHINTACGQPGYATDCTGPSGGASNCRYHPSDTIDVICLDACPADAGADDARGTAPMDYNGAACPSGVGARNQCLGGVFATSCTVYGDPVLPDGTIVVNCTDVDSNGHHWMCAAACP